MFFDKLINMLGGGVADAAGDLSYEPAGIASDHRKAVPGGLFVCIEGFVADGHAYAADALANGAVAIISQKPLSGLNLPAEQVAKVKAFVQVRDSRRALAAASHLYYGEPSKALALAGVTGTKGKTTTTYMIRSILGAAGVKTGLIGSICNYIGDEERAAGETTPESITLAGLFAEMAGKGCSHAVMEVSSQGLALRRVDFCDYDVGVYTNFYKDHISPLEHRDVAEYFEAKNKLFSLCKKAVINADIAEFEAVRAAAVRAGREGAILTYSADYEGANHGAADIRARDIELISDRKVYSRFYAETPWFSGSFTVNLPGRYNVSNALAAIAVCGLFGAPKEAVAAGLSGVNVRGRTELVSEGQNFTVLVDFAHNAASLEALLKMLHEYKFETITTVFGCGGNRARDRRFDMGEASGRLSGFTVITSDNPRKEEPAMIIADIVTGLSRTDGRYIIIEDRREAIKYAIDSAPEGSLVLIAGKGHETTQTFSDRTIPFDDVLVAREFLRERLAK